MSSLLPIVASLVGLPAMQTGAYDLAVAEKWGKAKVVKYRAEGVHSGREAVVYGENFRNFTSLSMLGSPASSQLSI